MFLNSQCFDVARTALLSGSALCHKSHIHACIRPLEQYISSSGVIQRVLLLPYYHFVNSLNQFNNLPESYGKPEQRLLDLPDGNCFRTKIKI